MTTITTERLIMRPWQSSDVDFVFDLYSRWLVQRYLGGNDPQVLQTRAQAVERIQRFASIDHPVHGVWAITRIETGGLVGTLLLKPIPASGEEPMQLSSDVEIGWHLHPDFWGNGYASEAALGVLAHAFAGDLNEVVAVTNPANRASQKVCRRIGMAAVGQTSKYYNATCELFVVAKPSAP